MEVDIFNFFSETEIEKIAKETGFVNRKSPITGFKFLLTFTNGMLNTNDSTLVQMATFLGNTCNAHISPQAVDQKINEKGKELLKVCLVKAFELSCRKYSYDIKMFDFLTHVFIIDSTNFDLHHSLSETFKGNHGSASKSSLRIQFAYDYLTGQMYIKIGDVRLSDAISFNEMIKNFDLKINGAALFISDLGYFKTDTFLLIDTHLDFFLSRFKCNVTIYDEQDNKINLRELLSKCTEFDIKIKLGNLSCRLVGQKLPEHVINEKLRKANKEAQKNGKTISEEYRKFLTFGIFITNLKPPFIFQKLFNIYRIRWQIELIFKTWKSILGIHKIRSARESRVLCEVYGKLIIAALANTIYWKIKFEHNVVLSYHKVLNFIKTISVNWTISILDGKLSHANFIATLEKQILKFCKKNKQSKKPYIEQILELTIIN